MNILQVNKFYYRKGGAESYVLDLSSYLKEHQYNVVPFAMQHEKNIASPYQKFFAKNRETEKVSINWKGLKTFFAMMYSLEAKRSMKSLLNDTKIDLAHVHSIYTQLSPSILDALHNKKIPTVMTVHDHHLVSPQYNIWADGSVPDVRNKSIWKAARSRFHKRSFMASFAQTLTFKLHRAMKMYEKNIDQFICPSYYLRNQMIAAGFSEQKVTVIPYGIETSKKIPSFKHDNYFFSVGRLSEEKGVDFIVDLARVLPELTFKIAGTGPFEKELHNASHDLSNIEWLGYQTGDVLEKLYEGATALLLPSLVHENFPLVTLEAMSRGTPVIANQVGGVQEIVKDRQTGMLVQVNDEQQWIEALLRLAYDEAFQKQLSKTAYNHVMQHHKPEDHFEKIEELYKKVVNKKVAH